MKTDIQQIITHNQPFFNEMVEKYDALKKTFKKEGLNSTNDFQFWVDIQDASVKEQIIALGFHISGSIKHLKKRKTIAVLQALNLDSEFCMNVSKAQEFYAMQKAFESKNGKTLKKNFDELLELFKSNTMDEVSYRKMHVIIDSFEQLFKIGRLKVFSTYLLGIPYKELALIKHESFREVYAKHIKVDIKMKEVDIISSLKKI